MKNIFRNYLVSVLFLLVSIDAEAQQDTLIFEGIKQFSNYVTAVYKQNYPSLTFLKHRLITPQYNIFDYYKGQETDSVCNALKYLSLVNDLDIANFENNEKINLNYVESIMFREVSKNLTPISISLIEYSEFKDSTIALNVIDFVNNKFVDKSPNGFYPFKKSILFASSTLNQVLFSNKVDFIFNDSLLLTNLGSVIIDSFEIDYGDGNGFQIWKKEVSHKSIFYQNYGMKNIKVKIKVNNQFFISTSAFELKANVNELRSSGCSTPIQPPDDGPFNISTNVLNTPVYGKYAIWYSTCNNTHKIRKPFIISAGFNPGNGKQLLDGLFVQSNFTFTLPDGTPISIPTTVWNGEWRGTYYETYNGSYAKRFSTDEYNLCGEHASNGNQLLDRLREEGYDVVILMYDNGEDITYNNAALFIELLQKINNEKFASGYHFESVVAGFSAGGLSTRLALSIMELRHKQNIGPNPHTKIWLNYEGENGGANIPLGFQHFLLFQSSSSNILPSLYPVQTQIDQLNQFIAYLAYKPITSNNASELLNYNAQVSNNTNHPSRTNLLNILSTIPLNNSKGYPEYCRRISISQGSGVGVNIPYTKPEIFDSKLKVDLGNQQVTSVPNSSPCSQQYNWKMPYSEKRTTARWWSANNNGNIFEAKVILDKSFTYLPLACIFVPIFGCKCTGPFEISAFVQLVQKNVLKPNNLTLNYDDAPASTSSSQIDLYNLSAYRFYNNSLAGDAFASIDPNLHSFGTTVSILDLHDPNNNYQTGNNYLSPSALGLMKINPSNQEPNLRFGFPHIMYPNIHYKVTPFDAVYAIGQNNGNFIGGASKPNNQMHVEDSQTFIADFLSQVEIAPENLFLSNRKLGASQNNYKAEFEARSKIIVGNGIYSQLGNLNYLTPDGDFHVNLNSHAILHAGDAIIFMPGAVVDFGAQLNAYIEGYQCSNTLR